MEQFYPKEYTHFFDRGPQQTGCVSPATTGELFVHAEPSGNGPTEWSAEEHVKSLFAPIEKLLRELSATSDAADRTEQSNMADAALRSMKIARSEAIEAFDTKD